jgi:hypothetical protein
MCPPWSRNFIDSGDLLSIIRPPESFGTRFVHAFQGDSFRFRRDRLV